MKEPLLISTAGRALAGDWAAICLMVADSKTAAERLRWQRVQMDFQLARERKAGYRTAQLWRASGCAPCPICEPLHGVLISTATPARYVLPEECPRLGRGCCDLSASTCIKRPDGTHYFDRFSPHLRP